MVLCFLIYKAGTIQPIIRRLKIADIKNKVTNGRYTTV